MNNKNLNLNKKNFQTDRFHYIHLSLNEFTLENFKQVIIQKFKLNSTYSILIKVNDAEQGIFKMCGEQIGLVINNDHDIEIIENIYNIIIQRIEIASELYGFTQTITGIELMYTQINKSEEFTLKNISNLFIPKHLVKIQEIHKNFNYKVLPFTTKMSYYGEPLVGDVKLEY